MKVWNGQYKHLILSMLNISSFEIKWVCGIIHTVKNKGGSWIYLRGPRAHTCWVLLQQWPFLWNYYPKPFSCNEIMCNELFISGMEPESKSQLCITIILTVTKVKPLHCWILFPIYSQEHTKINGLFQLSSTI